MTIKRRLERLEKKMKPRLKPFALVLVEDHETEEEAFAREHPGKTLEDFGSIVFIVSCERRERERNNYRPEAD